MYKVVLTQKADKELSRLSSVDIKRVIEKFPLLSSPFSSNLDVKKLTGASGFYRIRIGKVRIIFEILADKKEVWVRKIGYRGGVYS